MIIIVVGETERQDHSRHDRWVLPHPLGLQLQHQHPGIVSSRREIIPTLSSYAGQQATKNSIKMTNQSDLKGGVLLLLYL